MSPRPAQPARWRAFAPPLVALVAASLVAGVLGGLLRAGVVLLDAPWVGQAALGHAAVVIGAFFGSVIGIERAVAVKLRWAFAAPACSALGGMLLLAGQGTAGMGLLGLASIVFVLVNGVVVRRQSAAHTWLLLLSAVAWLSGNVLAFAGVGVGAVVPLWFAFLVITIAAERLELTRLMRRRPGAQTALFAVIAALLAAAGGSGVDAPIAGLFYGGALVLLAGWLGLFDIARRTIRSSGLTRFMAACLLTGYAWLAIAGIAWIAASAGLPLRDTALHALGLGFVFSMVMGHAPVILPAVSGLAVRYSPAFYLPLAVLHASLAWRLGAGTLWPQARALGSVLNALALATFVVTMLAAVLRARRQAVT